MKNKILPTIAMCFALIFFVRLQTQASTVTLSSGTLTYQATAGEVNKLTTKVDGHYFVFTELALNISTTVPTCTGNGTKEVFCDANSVSKIEIYLDDQDDSIWMESYKEQVFLDLGAGDDSAEWHFDKFNSDEDADLLGGNGNDSLKVYGDSLADNIVVDESGLAMRIERKSPSPDVYVDADYIEELEIHTDTGNDTIIFGPDFQDIRDVDQMKFRLYGDEGDDTIDVSVVEDTLFSTDYNIELHGGDGSDTLKGSQEKDVIDCGEGIDTYKDNRGPDKIDDSCDDISATQALTDILGTKFQYYITDLYNNGVISGYSDNKYHPEYLVTREQMAKFIVNAFGVHIDVNCANFSDVDNTNEFYTYIQSLKCADLISGYSDGTYRPKANVTRGEVTKFVAKAMQYNGVIIQEAEGKFPDVKVDNTFALYINFLTSLTVNQETIISGYSDGTYKPAQNLNRGEMSKVISNSRTYVQSMK